MRDGQEDQEGVGQFAAPGTMWGVVWIALVAILLYGVVAYIGLEDLRGYVEGAGAWGPLILILAKISTLVFAPLGGAPLYPIAGALFGPVYGFVYIFIGDVVGATLCFAISRRFGRRIVAYFVSDTGMVLVERILTRMGTARGLLEARFFFLAFPEALSYAFGLTPVSYWRFIVTHIAVYAVPILAVVWLGDALVNMSAWWSTAGLVAVMALALAGVAWFVIRARRDGE